MFEEFNVASTVHTTPVPSVTETMIDEILSDYVIAKVYENWSDTVFTPRVDYGGGIYGITSGMLLEALSIDTTGRNKILPFTKAEKEEIKAVCEKSLEGEPYG